MSSPTADLPGYRGPLPPSLTAQDMQHRRRLMARWKRRSLVVHALRRVLPTLCITVLVALMGWAAINTLFWRATLGKAGAGLQIRMLKPDFKGRNSDGRPFLLSAESAVRDDTDASRVTLEKPVFTLGSTADDKTVVWAEHGLYRDDTRILDLKGHVNLQNAQGYHFITDHAVIDTTKSNVDGEGHIDGSGPLGRIAASSYAVRDGGEHVYFTGQVKARIVQHAPAATAAQDVPAAKKR